MKKINLNIIFFIIFIAFFSILNLSQMNRPTVSVLENRALKARPAFSLNALSSGAYFVEIDEYFSDTFIFREKWVALARDIRGLKGFSDDTGAVLVSYNNNMADAMNEPEPDYSPGNNQDREEVTSRQPTPDVTKDSTQTQEPDIQPSGDNVETPSATPAITATPTTTPDRSEEKPATAEPTKVGGILIANGRAMETHYFAESNCKTYAATLNSFQEKLKSDVKVYSLVAPVSIAFYNVDKFKDITGPQDKTISTINSYFNGYVTPVDAYTPISQHTDEYIYFRSDHHWTALGAYYGYTGFMKTLGEEPVSIEKYETAQVEEYLGSLYLSTLSKTLESNPDIVTIYKPFISHEFTVYYEGPVKLNLIDMNMAKEQNKYRIFMSGDRPLSIIKTNVKNGKKIVIIKDSFGNALVPFLLPHYEEIYTVDPRQYKQNILKLIEENGIQDVLFVNYVNAIGMKGFLDLITEMTER